MLEKYAYSAVWMVVFLKLRMRSSNAVSLIHIHEDIRNSGVFTIIFFVPIAAHHHFVPRFRLCRTSDSVRCVCHIVSQTIADELKFLCTSIIIAPLSDVCDKHRD